MHKFSNNSNPMSLSWTNDYDHKFINITNLSIGFFSSSGFSFQSSNCFNETLKKLSFSWFVIILLISDFWKVWFMFSYEKKLIFLIINEKYLKIFTFQILIKRYYLNLLRPYSLNTAPFKIFTNLIFGQSFTDKN